MVHRSRGRVERKTGKRKKRRRERRKDGKRKEREIVRQKVNQQWMIFFSMCGPEFELTPSLHSIII